MRSTLLLLSALGATMATAADVQRAPAEAKTERRLVYGFDRRWIAIGVQSEKPTRIELPEGFTAHDVQLLDDSGAIVFTGTENGSTAQPLLYKWRPGDSAPSLIGDSRGRHAEPVLSQDRQWVYFAHHPDSDGPPGAHTSIATAQMYQVRVDGSGLKAMTAEHGCHLAPQVQGKIYLIYVHTNCSGGRRIVRRDLRSGKEVELTPAQYAIVDLAVSPDGRRILFSSQMPETIAVFELSMPGGKMTKLFEVPRTLAPRPRIQLVGARVWFQADATVKEWDSGRLRTIAAL